MTIKIQHISKQLRLTAGEQNLALQPKADTISVRQQVHRAQLGSTGHQLKLESVPDGVDEVVLIASATPASTRLQQIIPRLRLVTEHPEVELRTTVIEPVIETLVRPLTLQMQLAMNMIGAQSTVLPALCSVTDVVGDLVYAYGPMSGSRYHVHRVDPLILTKMPAWAVIISKIDDVKCTVQWSGIISGIYTGLTVGKRYFVDLFGRPSTNPPTNPGVFLQVIGISVGIDQLFLHPSFDLTRRYG